MYQILTFDPAFAPDEEGEELEDEFELSTPPDSDVSRPSTPQPSDSAKKNKKNRRRSVKEMDKGRIGVSIPLK